MHGLVDEFDSRVMVLFFSMYFSLFDKYSHAGYIYGEAMRRALKA